jgi:hypothetical protein
MDSVLSGGVHPGTIGLTNKSGEELMATILFVHGTGQRRDSVAKSLEKIRARAKQQPALAALAVENCLWGDPRGTQIGEGLSVPDYAERGGAGQPDPAELDVELWANLYADPLYELRLMALQPPAKTGLPGLSAGDRLNQAVTTFKATPELRSELARGDVDRVFDEARNEVERSLVYREMIRTASDPLGPFQDAVARAFVAMAIALFRDGTSGALPTIQQDRELRDACVKRTREALGPYQAALMESVVRRLQKLGRKVYWGTPTALLAPGALLLGMLARRRRGEAMDGSSPLVGDILFYQCRGEGIREFITFRIREVAPPVVIVAHSLGGVAAVDILVKENPQGRVALLVTVGSQAPYFYEINALSSLERQPGATLPTHFPPWVNIYDRRDFLSFVGARLFPGRVSDHDLDSYQPFPVAHSAYWDNEETYRIIADGVSRHLGTGKG